MSNESENVADKPSEQSVVHTPGPWKVANNSRSVLAGPVKINQQAGPAAQSAAVEARNEFTLRANAKLIAAAPELLFACRLLMEHINEGLVSVHEEKADNGQTGVSACELIEAAIKRAS